MVWARRAGGALLVAFAVCALVSCASRERTEVLYFYSAICPSCEESQRSTAGVASLFSLARENRRTEVRVWDVYHDEGAQDALLAAVDKYGVPLGKQGLPLLIVNGTASSGLDEVEAAIAEFSQSARAALGQAS